MSTSIRPFAVQPGEGAPLQTPTGDALYVRANTRNTGGSLTVVELEVSPKSGPALHTHLREDEVWFVLEGDFRFKAGDAMFWVSEGGMVFGPRCTPHSFQNVGDVAGRLLVFYAPSGAERLFEQYHDLLPGPVAPEMLSTLGHANWVELVGPPLGVSDPIEE